MYGYLIIEKGLPYDPGFKYTLTATPVILGRSSHQETPDLAFANWFISRRHCRIEACSTQAELTDLASKHGTRINNLVIQPEVPVVLQHNDRIVLAQGAVALRYWNWEETCDSTMEITQSVLSAAPSQNTTPIRLDVHRHQCFTETRCISLSPKEWNLLLLIYTSRPNPVTLDSIRLAVWPERIIQPATIPEVGVDEINLLVYRLRRKLGKTGSLIVNVRGAGWALK